MGQVEFLDSCLTQNPLFVGLPILSGPHRRHVLGRLDRDSPFLKTPTRRPCMRAKESNGLPIRRVLLSVSNKEGIVELARSLQNQGAELVATGNTARVLLDA